MFITTPDQEYILNILKKTRFMRTEQALRLLNIIDAGKNEQYVISLLKQLKHMEKIAWKAGNVFTVPLCYNEPVDEGMLAAVDIMLDMTDFKIASLSANNMPYKLCFCTEQENSIGNYAVIIVSLGCEMKITAALCNEDMRNRTIIFLLSEFAQREKIKTTLPHFFAIKDNGKYRYFKGGG